MNWFTKSFSNAPSSTNASSPLSSPTEEEEDEDVKRVKVETNSPYVEKLRALRDSIGVVGLTKKQGELTKCAIRNRKNMRKRYFILDTCAISYYTKAGDSVPKREIFLDIDSSIKRISDPPFSFELNANGLPQALLCCGMNEEEINAWVAAVNSVIKDLQDGTSKSRKISDTNSPKKVMKKIHHHESGSVDRGHVDKGSLDLDSNVFERPNIVEQWYDDKEDEDDEVIVKENDKKKISAHIEKMRKIRETVGNVGMVVKQGELTKHSIRTRKNTTRRYFILDPCCLCYYTKAGDLIPKREIFLDNETVVKRGMETASFELLTSSLGSPLICICDNEEDNNSWISAISNVIKNLDSSTINKHARKVSQTKVEEKKEEGAEEEDDDKKKKKKKYDDEDDEKRKKKKFEEDEDDVVEDEASPRGRKHSNEEDKHLKKRVVHNRHINQVRRQINASSSSVEAPPSPLSHPSTPPHNSMDNDIKLNGKFSSMKKEAFASTREVRKDADLQAVATEAAKIGEKKIDREKEKRRPSVDMKNFASAAARRASGRFNLPKAENKNNDIINNNWIEAKSDDGKIYYYHKITRVVRWEKPFGDLAEKIEASIEENEKEVKRRQEQRLKELRLEEDKKVVKSIKESKAVDDANDLVKLWYDNAKGDIILLITSIHSILPERVESPFSLASTSSSSDIKKAYMHLIRLVHPDKLAKEDVSITVRVLCEKVFASLTISYDKYRENL